MDKKDSVGIIITELILYLLSFALAYGTVNPFSISTTEEKRADSIFITLFTVLFIVSFGLSSLNKLNSRLEKFLTPLLFLSFTLLLSDIFYDINNANYFFVFKLFVAVIAFFALSMFMSDKPYAIRNSLIIYALSCLSIIVAAYSHLIDAFIYFNNGRLWIFGENPNSTSSRMVVAFLIFLYYASQGSFKKIAKFAFYGASLLLLYYIIQSGSRGSLIASLLGLMVLFSVSGMRRTSKILLVVISVLFSVFLLPSLESNADVGMFERMDELSEGNVRQKLIYNAVTIAIDYPIIGCGNSGYLQEKVKRGMETLDSHNLLASVLVMSGIVGLTSLLIFLWKVFIISWKIRKRNILGITLFLSMLFLAFKTGGVLTFMLMWYIYAVTIAISEVELNKCRNEKKLK